MTFYDQIMSEAQIERAVERHMNMLDRQFLNGEMDQDTYDREVSSLDRWAMEQYRYLRYERSL